LVTVLSVLAALALPGSAASVAVPACGDILTGDVVLTTDLVCSGNGLTIPGYVDVELDLNGHSIVGLGAGTGVNVVPDLSVDPSRTTPGDVVVENGSIRGFDQGLHVSTQGSRVGTTSLQLTELRITANGVGVVGGPAFGPLTTLANSMIDSNRGDGVNTAFVRFRIINDRVRDNGGYGIRAGEDSVRLLQDSFVTHNGLGGAKLTDTVAIVANNTFLANAGTGLQIDERLCFLLPFYAVSDNVADLNGGGGMRAATVGGPGCPEPAPPPGSGNAAKLNAEFQCILIICASNRGLAGPQDPSANVALPSHSS
jgi:hypothetical protein